MNYKKLGNTDLDVSTICLGTMTWGEQNSEKEGFEQMDFALSQGVNFWDTAEIYSIPMREETYGETEKIIGNWFQKTKKRNDIILATKVCGNTSNKYIRGGGNSFGSGRGGDGTGGLLILLVGGNLTIGASGGLYAKGVGGGTRLSSGQQVPGSGSGGGAIICAYAGTLSNSGTINVDGGIISTADNSDNTSYPCPQGGAGSYQLINLA